MRLFNFNFHVVIKIYLLAEHGKLVESFVEEIAEIIVRVFAFVPNCRVLRFCTRLARRIDSR